MRPAALLLGLPLLAAPPRFTVKDALRAEWSRQAPAFSVEAFARLPKSDRARLDLSLKRIGAPGAPALLPPELEKPTEDVWLRKAAEARTPQERFTSLYFLNRLKSPKALSALAGLSAKAAAAWPKHLHLEAGLASARLNGAEVEPELQAFLDALQKAGKVDPVRAQAARLRLVMAGKEPALLSPVKATPGSLLALMDAWNRAPWEKRKETTLSSFRMLSPESQAWAQIGIQSPAPAVLVASCPGIGSRILEGLPTPAPLEVFDSILGPWKCFGDPLLQWYAASTLTKFSELSPVQIKDFRDGISKIVKGNPALAGSLLPGLRKHLPAVADDLRAKLLVGTDPVARASALEDLAEAPDDLEALVTRLWKIEEYDGVQMLLQSLERWKLPEASRKALLVRFLDHPCWTARLDAHSQLKKLDPATPWPKVPQPNPEERAQLKLAETLAVAGKPVRLRITFSGQRRVTLKLDPVNAPLNVANLVRLAKQGYFNGRRVPRVVPDFVVQMGSPLDTMDGGPGYTVRCENSLTWYGPGSVGMALSGKDTGGSQFFITTNATPHLTGRYTRVGQLEDLDRALPLLDALELGAKIERIEVLAR